MEDGRPKAECQQVLAVLDTLDSFLPNLTFRLNAALSFTHVSDTLAQFTGSTVDELIGTPFSYVLDPADTEISQGILEHTRCRARLLDKDGRSVWHELRVRRDDIGGCVVSAFEVELLVKAESLIARERRDFFRKLDRQTAQLERAERMKNAFLTSMSHELRTPLTAILGLSEALRSGFYGDCSPEQTEAAHTVNQCGKQLLELINNILDVAKLELDQVELELNRLTSQELLHSVARAHEKSARQKGVELEVRAEDEFVEFLADRKRLKQVLLSLTSNAVKFTSEGSTIIIEARTTESELTVSVLDRGPGVEDTQLEQMLEPFRQLSEGLARSHGGVGLGLSLAEKLLRLMNGRLAVRKRAGGGSCFSVAVPVEICKAPTRPLKF